MYQRYLNLVSDDGQVFHNLGVGCFYLGDKEQALDYFKLTLEMDPNFVTARYYRGVTYLSQGRAKTAIEDLESVLAIAPEYPQAEANLGVAFNTDGQPSKSD